MTSLEFESSPDDPSPRIAGLVDETLRKPFALRAPDESSPETTPLTLHCYDGVVILQKLLPDLPLEAIRSLRDAIAEQKDETSQESEFAPAEIEPATLFGRWVKKMRSHFRHEEPEVAVATKDAIVIEIIEPIEGHTKQMHVKSYPECHAIVVRKSSLSGSFKVNGEFYAFNPEHSVLEVGSGAYNPAPTLYSEYFDHDSRRHYTYVPHRGDVYRSNQYGGALTDKKIQSEKKRNKMLQKMATILEEVHTTTHPTTW